MIKKLIAILILINLGLLSYFNADLIFPSTSKVVDKEINPEKIQILTPQQIQTLPKKSTESPISSLSTNDTAMVNAQPAYCYEWGIFSKDRITYAQIATANIALQPSVIEASSFSLVRSLDNNFTKDNTKNSASENKDNAKLLFKDISAEKVTALQKLKSNFPEANLKEVSCN